MAWIITRKWLLAGALSLLTLTNTLSYCKGREHVENKYATQRARIAEKARQADAAAAAARMGDERTQMRNERARNDAIDKAQDSAPDDANRQLACERLRQAGVNRLPPGC